MIMDFLRGYFYLLNAEKSKVETDHSLMQKCYEEGFAASTSGLLHTENPYSAGSKEAEAWNRGFWVW